MDYGLYRNGSLACFGNKRSRAPGIFYGDNPLHRASPILFVQIVLSSLFSAILQNFLAPLGQTTFISQTIAGIVLGPSILGKIRVFQDNLFPDLSYYIMETFAYTGLILFLFLIGVKTDMSLFRKCGKKAVVIGVFNFFTPLIFNGILALLLANFVPMDPLLRKSLSWLATFPCLSAFYVIVGLLTDLHLLNSELGRLAVCASIVSGTCSWTWCLILFASRIHARVGRTQIMIVMFAITGFTIFVILNIFQPIMRWMVKRTGEGKAVKETYIITVFVMILCVSMFSEIVGQSVLIGPTILGMAVPEGPPLGSTLVSKLDSFVNSIFFPIYFVVTGSTINLSIIDFKRTVIVGTFAFLGLFWRIIGTLVTSLYCNMSLNDSISLALIMSVQGVTEVLLIRRAAELKYIDAETYSILVVLIVIFTVIISPIVKFIYKPSRRYITYKRRTIQHTKPSAGLRMLACMYRDDHTHSIMNLLQASNPSPNSPVSFYLLHLMDLIGRSAPFIVFHKLGNKSTLKHSYSEHIVNAFRLYEEEHQGSVTVNPFTIMSPFVTMHDEVCSIALDKKVSLVILPFHKFWTLQGTEETANAIRIVNKNVLRVAPCSVGILVDRGTLGSTISKMTGETMYNIAVIFLGGHDDRESLAYANRMVKRPNVNLTVFRLIECHNKEYRMNIEAERDFSFVNEFRMINARNEQCVYKEEMVNDSVDMVSVIRSMENDFDLIMVGRRHNTDDSDLLLGLTEWNEFPELGFIGDMLASSDSNCTVSVLVIQQQHVLGGGVSVDSPRSSLVVGDSTIVDMPRDSRVWPTPT